MYNWRKLSEPERQSVLLQRQIRQGSWRRPPVWEIGTRRYMITAACFEHQPFIGTTAQRIAQFENDLLSIINEHSSCLFAHAILPNHYHVLIEASDIKRLRESLGKFHGRTSFEWNKEDNTKGRKVFHGSAETVMKSERHFQATLNYIHHNPVKHGYVEKWQDWPFSSAARYLQAVGEKEALRHWNEYPVERYGADWDR